MKFYNEEDFFNSWYVIISHEITHVVDPKIKFPRNETNTSVNYYSSPVEFDGNSKQIIEDLKISIKYNPNLSDTILNWIKNPKKYSMPADFNQYFKVLKQWEESDKTNNTDYVRRFKTRVYNELFKKEREKDV